MTALARGEILARPQTRRRCAAKIGTGSSSPRAALRLFIVARYCGRNLGAPPASLGTAPLFSGSGRRAGLGTAGLPAHYAVGVRALRLLQRNGFSVVLNTARSLEHVREYCARTGLPGGVAELGSVFWDAVRGLGSAADRCGIRRPNRRPSRTRSKICRESSSTRRTDIRYAPIASRMDICGRCRPRKPRALLERAGCDRLTFVQSTADTYIVQKGAGKGPALASVRPISGCSGEPVAAIGDSAPGRGDAARRGYRVCAGKRLKGSPRV